MQNQTENRKEEHIKISLKENVRAKRKTTGFEDINFIHKALPEIARKKISLKTEFFNHKFTAPILIGAITGGTKRAVKINTSIAEAVEELGLGMGVGSQRAAIEKPELRKTYGIVREKAPNAFLIANIGAPQLAEKYGVAEAEEAVNMIEADALAIHLNPLQEAVQPEGDTNFSGVLDKIKQISETLNVPLLIKETGAGMSREVAKKLEEVGVKGIDVSGAGGTSWAAVEYYRAKDSQDMFHQQIGESFWDWGIPTAISIIEVAKSTNVMVVASGGVRTGIDVAKGIALGANLASLSKPILNPACKSSHEVKETLSGIIEELRTTMFLTGARNISELGNMPIVIRGNSADWLRQRGFKPEEFAGR